MPSDFSDIYDENVWFVHGYFAYRLRRQSDVEDLTQTTFEKALRGWPSFDPRKGSARNWLLAIARNTLIDDRRRDRSGLHRPLGEEGALEDDLPTATPEPELGIEPGLARALATLGARERELIALRFGADLTGPEIAELTGLSLANVQQILSRSLRRLRAALEPDE